MIQEWPYLSQYFKCEWQVLTVGAIACLKLEATSICIGMVTCTVVKSYWVL